VVMVSRFAKQKDHATLVRAIGVLRDRGYSLPLYLAGSGKDRDINKIKSLVAELQLDSLVHFVGYQHNVAEFLASKTFTVQCSNWEGSSLSTYEGMAAGCAVVVTNIPALRECVRDGETGFWHAHADAEDLANKLAFYLDNPDQAATIAAAGQREVFNHHSKEFMNDGYERLFLSLKPM